MADYITIHPKNPQLRLLKQVADKLNNGAVMAYPTDSAYALGFRIGDRDAMDRVRRIRQFADQHLMTLVCASITQMSVYAKLSNHAFRLVKANTPGPVTFVLPVTREVPKRMLNPKRKAIGVRIPDNAIVTGLLEMLNEPIMSTTLQLPDQFAPFGAPEDIFMQLSHLVDIVIDGGSCGIEPTTVVDLTETEPVIVRQSEYELKE